MSMGLSRVLGQLPCTFTDPARGVELVHCSSNWTKTTLPLLYLRFDYPMDPPFQDPRIDESHQSYNILSHKELQADLIYPWGHATKELFDHFCKCQVHIWTPLCLNTVFVMDNR